MVCVVCCDAFGCGNTVCCDTVVCCLSGGYCVVYVVCCDAFSVVTLSAVTLCCLLSVWWVQCGVLSVVTLLFVVCLSGEFCVVGVVCCDAVGCATAVIHTYAGHTWALCLGDFPP